MSLSQRLKVQLYQYVINNIIIAYEQYYNYKYNYNHRHRIVH